MKSSLRSSGVSVASAISRNDTTRVLVVVAINRDRGTGGDHPRAMRSNQNEIKSIFDLINTIFNCDASHRSTLLEFRS